MTHAALEGFKFEPANTKLDGEEESSSSWEGGVSREGYLGVLMISSVVEALAILHGICFATDLVVPAVLESDALSVVDAIRLKVVPPSFFV
ncbi:hypothetical protein Q3G72_018487 [Acer saccharum]|nr:hypothetical protein Q3G72_018487 [Acer saccharum]